MAETRIDTPRSAESRVAKTTAQAMTSVKSTLAAGDEAPAFSSLLAALDSFAATGLPQVALPPGDAQEEKTTLPGLAEQDTLLVAQGHAPWMSLVGQTARLDTQGDDDMRQGAATDFLSGRSNVTQLAHRQALQTGDVGAGGAHAAFMGKDLQSNQPQTQSIQAQVAANFDEATLPVKADHSEQSQSALLAAADEPVAARAEQAAQKLQAAGHQGVSLQGMTAVQPQTLEGLKYLLRAARPASLDEGGVAGKPGSSSGSHDLTGAAVAIGAAMGAAGAGMQGGGQNASDLGQSLSGQESAPAEREQEVSEQVAFWVHQKVQNASLSIQHEGKPIQVQVQLNGQEAHVRFAADDEQARQLLADGQSQLRELLEAQGLNLSGVSVDAGGAHQQGAGGQSDDGQRAQARSARVAVNAADLPVDALNTRQVSRAAQTGVDLFV